MDAERLAVPLEVILVSGKIMKNRYCPHTAVSPVLPVEASSVADNGNTKDAPSSKR